ncbi:MAG: Peptidase rhomboid domain protein [Gemmatimonadetes bacterium]|jgi:membrane associated rhomboid family serine protease|nr:Peptidase rhomboid domain protein [Gemmatimonadota bacterium]
MHDERASFRLSRAVPVLIALNAAILFLQWTLVSDADAYALLGFHQGALPRSAWTALTYMFVHFGLWHLALNMYALFVFGPRLESAMGTRAFTLFYLWCGLGGAVAHMLFVRSGVVIGASAAVLGVMFGYAQQWPDEEVALFGIVPMRTWTMVMLFAATNLALGLLDAETAAGTGGWHTYLAHAGGIAFAWLYMRTPPAASIERLRQRISPAPDYVDEAPRAIPRTLPRARAQRDEVDEIVAESRAIAAQQQRPAPRVVPPSRSAVEAPGDAVNRVLDKISSHGLASLSAAERAVLDEMARRLQEKSS